ncbi:MAG: ATP-binding protein [Pyrinomonadaceae bacterium MAG19_C2-C3]|nr:ATP-binding protein [Pyrinomonadaceae bacterium MAG19_C2-C3]
MLNEPPTTKGEAKAGRTVYRRAADDDDNASSGEAAGGLATRLQSLAPMLLPLIVGFVLLVVIICLLGWQSVKRLNVVSDAALALQSQRGAQFKLLLEIKTTLGTLNNEARARHEQSARDEFQSPLARRLGNARKQVEALREQFERTPYVGTEAGAAFLRDLDTFIEITEDERRYSLEGFEAFARVDGGIENFLRLESEKQDAVLQQTNELQRAAARRIINLTLFALLVGVVISGATVWEVQRRFRSLQLSLLNTRRERQFSHQVLSSMVNAVATLDGGGNFRTVNPAFVNLFPDARTGTSVHSALAADDSARVLSTVAAQKIDKPAYRGRFVFGEASGARTFDAYVAPLRFDEERGAILTFVDVTEAVNAESELRRRAALAAVGQATAQISHEIKNPLGSIRLGVSMLREMVTDAEALSTIDLIERGIAHLNKLTVDVTKYSSQRELELAATDIHQVINESLELVRDRTNEKHINIKKSFDERDVRGMFDADALRQIFVNLIANAIDATDENGVVEIVTKHTADRVRIVIADAGGGINERTLPHLFEPFFTTKKRGTGLGLAITRKIVEQHGGRIDVESKVGEGTRFTVELPLKKVMSDE